MRLIWSLFCYSFVLFVFSLVSFVVFWGNGEFVGILLFCCAGLMAIFFGDRFLLYSLKSRKIRGLSPVIQKINNLTFRKSLPDVEVYSSSEFKKYVFAVEGLMGRPYLILGDKFDTHLNDEELEILLTFALRKIQNRDSLFNSLFIFSTILLIFPIFITTRWKKSKQLLSSVLLNLLRPLFYFHRKFSQRFDYQREKLLEKDHVDSQLLEAVWPKFRPVETGPSYLKQFLMSFVAVVEKDDDFLTESLLRC